MTKRPFLTFRLHELLFAIDSMVVKEILWLPEVTPAEEVPDYITGIINYRGRIIPVTDLNRLFSHDYSRYNLSDSIIVVESSEAPLSAECGVRSAESKDEIRDTLHEVRLLGLIVNEVRDVIDLSPADIEPYPFYSDSSLSPQPSTFEMSRHHFIDSEAKAGESIILILNTEKIFDAGFHPAEAEGHKLTEHRYFCPEASPEEKSIFHERAVNLMLAVEEEKFAGLIPMAVVSLGNEYFGMDMELIREFSDILDLAPVPCCPEHILGNMNLRGNVLTVLDIRESLNLSSAEFGMRNAELKTKDSALRTPHSASGFSDSALRTPHSAFEGKVIVADTGGLSAGIAVDNVFDVVYINPSDIKPVPSAVRTKTEQYIKGTAPYNNKVMTILDLKRILEREEWVVNEEA